ncbi:MAG: efflux RND transporter periplasmic adaptor subunit, partial [Planctomycetota bacterium]|nr:efflux RND transporter periplasmic adaptor subunit [Planctomycetota bacterium]
MPLALPAFGTVEASATVEIKPQVTAVIEKIHFAEGQWVKAGDLLFTLDARPFAAALRQAKANLARDRIQAENAEKEAERAAALLQQGVTTQQDYDKKVSAAQTLRAMVSADEAAVENAEIQLAYCTIRAPVSGRAGECRVDAGNLVKAGEAILVVLNATAPVHISFTLPEKELPAVRHYAAQGELEVEAEAAGEEGPPAKGKLGFIDNSVDTATGTIRLKAEFANEAERLWRGQFVRVRLTLPIAQEAVVAPAAALFPSQDGQAVFVVKDDRTVELRPVRVKRLMDGAAVIAEGIRGGETVVIEGQINLRPGIEVAIK